MREKETHTQIRRKTEREKERETETKREREKESKTQREERERGISAKQSSRSRAVVMLVGLGGPALRVLRAETRLTVYRSSYICPRVILRTGIRASGKGRTNSHF